MPKDSIDCLLLHYVCQLKIPAADLYRDDLEIAFNLPHHRLSKQQVKARLDGLHSTGMIDLFDYHYNTYSLVKANRFNCADNTRQFYGLSTVGGQGLYRKAPCTGYAFAEVFTQSQTEPFVIVDWHLSWELATANLQ